MASLLTIPQVKMGAYNFMQQNSLWNKFCENFFELSALGFRLDISRMRFSDSLFETHSELISKALSDMKKLEAGEIANRDENRMVGHYWLRTPSLSPNAGIKKNIEDAQDEVIHFSNAVRSGEIKGENNSAFVNVVIIGIGGSALGPQLVSDSLCSPTEKIKIYFCDNTDPDGIERLKATLSGSLQETLCIVISKSGGTVETKNGMIEFEAAYSEAGLNFSKHAVAITCEGSKLDTYTKANNWLKQFYMWDWVGGRTSLFSQVGLLPAALQGIDINSFIEGARIMDEQTRVSDYKQNPALLLSLMWLSATEGKGKKDMVILPYKDRLVLFSKYLQQLVMESLGKEEDLNGEIVHQGISVYGNKGSTDQHAYIQQLRDGVNNFFATFIEVIEDYTPTAEKTPYTNVEDGGITSGAYLNGFFQGTRTALFENKRDSVTITIESLNPKTLGALIALFERAVSFYASYVNINAYNQPGVEAGKKAAGKVIELRKKVLSLREIGEYTKKSLSALEIAIALQEDDEAETIYRILEHLSINHQDIVIREGSSHPEKAKYTFMR